MLFFRRNKNKGHNASDFKAFLSPEHIFIFLLAIWGTVLLILSLIHNGDPILYRLAIVTYHFAALLTAVSLFSNDAFNRLPKANILYVSTQIALAIIFGTIFFTWTLKTPDVHSYSWIDIIWLLIAACTVFIAYKWLTYKHKLQFFNLISSLYYFFEFLYLSAVVFLTFLLILKLNGLPFLPYIYSVIFIFFIIALGIGIAVAFIKGELLTNFDYILIPFSFSDNKKPATGPVKFLETYTGLSLKSIWSIHYVSKILPGAVLAFLALLLLSTSFYIIEPHEEGIVYRFGKLASNEVKTAGFHAKLPWPIDKAEIFDTRRIKYLLIGYEDRVSEDFLWGLAHSGDEHTLLLGNGNELVAVNMKTAFHIGNLCDYLTTSANPEEILAAKIYNVLMEKTVTTELDTFLEVDRIHLSEAIHKELQRYTDSIKLGISVDEVIIESIHPPIEVASVYQNVVGASIKKTTTTIKAETEAVKKLKEAEKSKEVAILNSSAYQTQKISDAQYELTVYSGAYEAFNSHPKSFRLSKYLNTYERILKENKVYIFSSDIKDSLSQYIIPYNQNILRITTGENLKELIDEK